MTKEEFLKKIGRSEEEIIEAGQELVAFDDDSPDCDGWEVRYKDKSTSIGLGCRCSESGTLHKSI